MSAGSIPFPTERRFAATRASSAGPSAWRSGGVGVRLLVGLAIVGLLVPSSSRGEILQSETASITLLIAALTMAAGVRYRIASRTQLVIGALIVGLLVLFSAFWTEERIAWGALVPYLFFASVVSLRLDRCPESAVVRRAWLVLSAAILILGYGIAADNQLVELFVLANYAAFYEDLLRSMIHWSGKPVTVFGTHSLAATFHFLFFAVNLRLGVVFRRPVHVAAALAFVPLTYLLKSNSALLALAMMGVTGFAFVLSTRSYPRIAVALASVLTLLALVTTYIDAISADVVDVLEKQTSGFLIRFGEGGVLRENLAFVATPVGIADLRGRIFYGDSGLVEYLTRGSLPLMVLMYFAFYRFLKMNLRRPAYYLPFFVAVLLFESGFSTLVYYRFEAILPLAVLALNVRRR